jgi:hypothetical protein
VQAENALVMKKTNLQQSNRRQEQEQSSTIIRARQFDLVQAARTLRQAEDDLRIRKSAQDACKESLEQATERVHEAERILKEKKEELEKESATLAALRASLDSTPGAYPSGPLGILTEEEDIGCNYSQSSNHAPPGDVTAKKENPADEPTRVELIVAGCMVVLVLIAVAMLMILLPNLPWNQEDEAAATDGPETQANAIVNLRKNLPSYTQESFLDPDSPQSQALRFMEQDPKLPTYEEWKRVQRFALATVHTALYHFLPQSTMEECEWFESILLVSPPCHAASKHFQHLELALQLDGFRVQSPTIPPELSLLQDLTSLTVYGKPDESNSSNMMTLEGFLPTELAVLSDFGEITMQDINLQGTIPAYIFDSFTNLETIDWSNNDLTGPLPSDLHLLSNLVILDVSSNSITGPLPSNWEGLSRLFRFSAHNNLLKGTIPSQMGEQLEPSFVQVLSLANNTLTGSLPSELGLLERLVLLDVAYNALTGSIPLEFESLASFRKRLVLKLQGNSFQGEIPRSICHTVDRDMTTIWADCDKEFLCCVDNANIVVNVGPGT